jgi:hypothetical protein
MTLGLNEGFKNVVHMAQLLRISRHMELQHFQNFGIILPFQWKAHESNKIRNVRECAFY